MTLANALKGRVWLVTLAALIVLVIVNAYLQSNLFTPRVLKSNLTVFLPLVLIAVGQTYVILAGDIDLSVGAIVALVNVVTVTVIAGIGTEDAAAVLAGILAGLATGVACGLFNGFLVAALRLQPIVATFATGILFSGIALRVLPTAGLPVPAPYWRTYAGGLFALPVVLWIFIAVLIAVGILGARPFLRHLTAVGGHRAAAFQTGLAVTRVRIGGYVLAALFSAVASLCLTGETASGDPLMGGSLALGSVSAVVLGGTALSGGSGSAFGSVLGALVIGMIGNVIFFAGLPFEYQTLVKGVITLAALAGGVVIARR
ncbi:ABC transporter permease [Consotaella salsifontis]|uniref:Monosaccharide ABC transporter membrane protein, CUT2 family n=1 Tax=Consotaella salsifontis TaxID=1365950 RepID=A0A1T4TBY6_9HYPH|nr:ABC transporter permease [Consotaella salsifontis]SKA37729.1 monosaccharide ABC transporter membrane protein, CUT2 family [Consotaella salsifontis]